MAVSTMRSAHHYKRQDFWDKFWKDRDGNIVIYQHPNVFLIVWAVLTLVSLFTFGKLSDVVWWIAQVDLVVWSLLEIFRGVNYFRRTLGAVVLLLALMSIFKVGL